MTPPLLLFPLLVHLSTLAAAQSAASTTPQAEVPVTLTLRISAGRSEFRPGEIIPIELEFHSTIPKRFRVDGAICDRSGRLTIDEFRLHPQNAAADPMLDYPWSGIGGGLRGTGVLGDRPYVVRLDLNEWFRFDRPGTFRLAVRSKRVADQASPTYTVVPIESNSVSFRISPRDAAWEASELETARRLADATGSSVDSQKGCRIMRFLGTPAAVDEMIRRHGTNTGCDFELRAGLFGAAGRAYVVTQMENGIQVAAQPVTASYLSTLARLSTYLKHPEFRPPPQEATDQSPAGDDLRRREELIEAAAEQYAGILAEALPQKTGRARAISLAEQLQPRPLSSPGSFSATSREQIAATFLQLPEERQERLLDFQWSTVASPVMVPALRRLMERRQTVAGPVTDLALRRLFDLAPEEARPLILRGIQSPGQGATLKTLGRLPDTELPALDEALAANFDAVDDLEEIGDFNGAAVRAGLVHRYASRAIADRILRSASVPFGRMACAPQAATLAYFLRVDEIVGKNLLDRALAPREGPGCRTRLAPVAALRAAPAIEALAIARLNDSEPDVVVDAIETLGRHGSPAAFAPLRASFERWHMTWAGRASELRGGIGGERPHGRQAMVENAFQQALGAGKQWLTTSTELRVLGGLCVTDNCRTWTAHMARVADDTRILILRVDEPDSSLVQLAQYSFQSIAALQEKLGQYPRGASFTMDVGFLDPAGAASVVSRILKFAGDHGIWIAQQP